MYPAQRRARMVAVDVPPYEMCTIEECQLRIRTNEISIWERSHTPTTTNEEEEDSNNDHHDRHCSRRHRPSALFYDPCKVITKYRRSVAGGSPLLGPPRSLTALQTTVQYLIHHIYIPQPQQQQHYLSQISFWEDRIRAVQVDLVRSNVTSKLIQQFIVKCYILLLYILSDCIQYEHTFGHTALQTSLSGYWEDCCRTTVGSSSVQQRGTTTCISDAMDDEILSYNICIQLHQQLQILMSIEENIVAGRPHTTTTTTTSVRLFWSQCTELYRQVTTMTTGSNTDTTTTTLLQRLPFLQWTFRLAFQCMGGYWQSALSMLLQQPPPLPPQPRDTQQSSGPSSSSSLLLQSLYNNNNNVNKKSDAMTYSPQDWERFQVLVKCTLAPALPYLRYKVLQTMNVTYMKNEGISITEVARLLCYDYNSSFLECWEFCRRWGLPIHENEQIRCKVVPIQPFQRTTTDRVRSNDAVILGNDTPYYTSSDDILVPSPEWMTTMLT
jgi:SAC3/GANP family